MISTIFGIILIIAMGVAVPILYRMNKRGLTKAKSGDLTDEELNALAVKENNKTKLIALIFISIIFCAIIAITIFGEGTDAIGNHEWFKPPWD